MSNAKNKLQKLKLFNYLRNPLNKIVKLYWNKQLRGKYLTRMSQIHNKYVLFKPF